MDPSHCRYKNPISSSIETRIPRPRKADICPIAQGYRRVVRNGGQSSKLQSQSLLSRCHYLLSTRYLCKKNIMQVSNDSMLPNTDEGINKQNALISSMEWV